MIERLVLGDIADKPHTVLRNAQGELQHEECFTRRGFDGSYSIAYHAHPPMEDTRFEPSQRGWAKPVALEAVATRKLFLPPNLPIAKRPLDAHTTLLTNNDVDVSVLRPAHDDDAFLADNDGDLLYFVFEGSAQLETPFGALAVAHNDYVWVPRSLPHRFLQVKDAFLLAFEAKHGLRLPAQYLNDSGQLKMDAPYSHRDFRRPTSLPRSKEQAVVVVKRQGRFYERVTPSLLDVVGLDGFVYPVAFNVLRFQPKTGQVHLPPPVHATFVAQGLIVCSFVPRLTDTHPQAIPCPYPHSSVDCDEMLFYCRGNFTSRKGVGPGAISLHPAGIPHGPHPGAYEGSIGTTRTDELAIMLDTSLAPVSYPRGGRDRKQRLPRQLEAQVVLEAMTVLQTLFRLSYADTRAPKVRLEEGVRRMHEAIARHQFTGVYLLRGDALELAAFAGAPTVHTRIPLGRGLCGKAVTQARDLDIADVTAEPEYLSCSVTTRSEAIALIWREGRIIGQIDADSDTAGAFGPAAMQQLRACADLLAPLCAQV